MTEEERITRMKTLEDFDRKLTEVLHRDAEGEWD